MGKLPEQFIQKTYIMVEYDNIIECIARVLYCWTSRVIYNFLYMSTEGCFTFIIHHFNNLWVKLSYIKDKMPKKTVICIHAQMCIKTWIFELAISQPFLHGHYCNKRGAEAVLKELSNDIDISEKPEFVDSNYQWNAGADIYERNIACSVYSHTWVKHGSWWIIKELSHVNVQFWHLLVKYSLTLIETLKHIYDFKISEKIQQQQHTPSKE